MPALDGTRVARQQVFATKPELASSRHAPYTTRLAHSFALLMGHGGQDGLRLKLKAGAAAGTGLATHARRPKPSHTALIIITCLVLGCRVAADGRVFTHGSSREDSYLIRQQNKAPCWFLGNRLRHGRLLLPEAAGDSTTLVDLEGKSVRALPMPRTSTRGCGS